MSTIERRGHADHRIASAFSAGFLALPANKQGAEKCQKCFCCFRGIREFGGKPGSPDLYFVVAGGNYGYRVVRGFPACLPSRACCVAEAADLRRSPAVSEGRSDWKRCPTSLPALHPHEAMRNQARVASTSSLMLPSVSSRASSSASRSIRAGGNVRAARARNLASTSAGPSGLLGLPFG